MTIRQHRPSYISGFENETQDFKDLNGLLNIEFVKRFAVIPEFYRFSQSDKILMAEYKEGKEWWVVGYLSNEIPGLPEWKK